MIQIRNLQPTERLHLYTKIQKNNIRLKLNSVYSNHGFINND